MENGLKAERFKEYCVEVENLSRTGMGIFRVCSCMGFAEEHLFFHLAKPLALIATGGVLDKIDALLSADVKDLEGVGVEDAEYFYKCCIPRVVTTLIRRRLLELHFCSFLMFCAVTSPKKLQFV